MATVFSTVKNISDYYIFEGFIKVINNVFFSRKLLFYPIFSMVSLIGLVSCSTSDSDSSLRFTSSGIVEVDENIQDINYVVTVENVEEYNQLNFGLSGGEDESFFKSERVLVDTYTDEETGIEQDVYGLKIIFSDVEGADFDNPQDSNGDNSYIVDIQASDSVSTATLQLIVKVNDVNDEPPVFTSDDRGYILDGEKLTSYVAVAEDTEPLGEEKNGSIFYSLSNDSEDDSYLFEINSSSGQVSSLERLYYDDTEATNYYSITVEALENGNQSPGKLQVLIEVIPSVNANGGGSRTVLAGTVAALDGSDSFGAEPLTYKWSIYGDNFFDIEIKNSNSAIATYNAPDANSEKSEYFDSENVRFNLKVTDKYNSVSSVIVTHKFDDSDPKIVLDNPRFDTLKPRQVIFEWYTNPSSLQGKYILEYTSDGVNYNPLKGFSDSTMGSVGGMINLFLPDVNVSSDRFRVSLYDYNDELIVRSSDKSFDQSLDLKNIVGYFKADNTDDEDSFGFSSALSYDGKTLVVGAPFEDGSGDTITVNGNYPDDSSEIQRGAVYVFQYSDVVSEWYQQAYIKPSQYTDYGFNFGYSVALSADGDVLVVGATYYIGTVDSNIELDNSKVFVFRRDESGIWEETAIISNPADKAYNTLFGGAVALNDEGNMLAVSALFEPAGPADSRPGSGVVYVFDYEDDSGWSEISRLVPVYSSDDDYEEALDYTYSWDLFGFSLAFDSDGDRLAIGAPQDASLSEGIFTGGDIYSAASNVDYSEGGRIGAVYVYKKSNSSFWNQEAYIKPGNLGYLAASSGGSREGSFFGGSLDFSENGLFLVVGAPFRTDSNDSENPGLKTGAVHTFEYKDNSWTETNFIQPDILEHEDRFGSSVAIDALASTMVIGSFGDNEAALSGFYSPSVPKTDAIDSTTGFTGAAYFYVKNSELDLWDIKRYIKAPFNHNINEPEDFYYGPAFGSALDLSADGGTLAISASKSHAQYHLDGFGFSTTSLRYSPLGGQPNNGIGEDSGSKGINIAGRSGPEMKDDSQINSGAIFLF